MTYEYLNRFYKYIHRNTYPTHGPLHAYILTYGDWRLRRENRKTMRWHSRDLAAWGEGEGGIREQCMQGKQSAPQDKSRGPLLHTCVPYFLVLQLLSSLHDAGGRAFPARRKGREQADLAATQNRARERQFLAPGSRVSAFDPGEPLHEAGGDVGCFRQGELFCVGTYRTVSISSIGKGFQSLKKRKEKKRKGRGAGWIG